MTSKGLARGGGGVTEELQVLSNLSSGSHLGSDNVNAAKCWQQKKMMSAGAIMSLEKLHLSSNDHSTCCHTAL